MREKMTLFDFDKSIDFLTRAVAFYQDSAPVVSDYLNDLYVRLQDDFESISLLEVRTLEMLNDADELANPHYATNLVYKMLQRLNRDVVGVSDF